MQGGSIDHSCHLLTLVAMSSGEAEFDVSATVAWMRASHLRMLTYDIIYFGIPKFDGDNLDYEPINIIIDNEAAIYMVKYIKDATGNRHVAQRIHYVRQGTALRRHKFEWIGTKQQLADILTKVGNRSSFGHLWSLVFHEDE